MSEKIRKWILRAFVIIVCAVMVVLILTGYSVEWTGFGDFTPPTGDFNRRKTLWDWMELVLIPAALFFLARYFSDLEKRRGETQEKLQREHLVNEQQGQILQSYLDRMQTLVLEKELDGAQQGTSLANFARTLTLVTLQRLLPEYKTVILQFLDESTLIQQRGELSAVISLNGADLDGVGLPFGLAFANLEGCDLGGASLKGARLDFVNFEDASLTNTIFENASLIGANLRGADLTIALLKGANLFDAQYDETTILPNGKAWANTDMTIFGAILKAPLSEKEYREIGLELHADEE